MAYENYELNEMQFDALKEIGNIGSGHAASALSSMLDRPIDMNVPQISILDYNEVVNIPFVIIEPENTKEEVSSILYRDELASYTARAGSRPYTRDINLRLSCEKINGTVLLPGQVFDYNKALGKRTPENGWKKADGYLGGQTVSEYVPWSGQWLPPRRAPTGYAVHPDREDRGRNPQQVQPQPSWPSLW